MKSQAQYLVLSRHGQSFANVCTEQPSNGRYFYEISGSDKSVGITRRGRSQSRYSGHLIARLFPTSLPLGRVWISEFARIEQSADEIVDCLDYHPEVIVDPRLNKRGYGIFWNMTYAGVENLHPDQYRLYRELGALKYRPPEGENYFDLFERIDEFVDCTLNTFSGNQLIVGHSAAMLAIQRRIEGLPDSEVVRQYNTVCIPNGHVLVYMRQDSDSPWSRSSVAELLASEA